MAVRARPALGRGGVAGGEVVRRLRAPALLAGLAVLLGAAFVLAVGVGPIAIPPGRVVAILLEHAGIGTAGASPEEAVVVWQIRLPRAVLAVVVGAGLGISGAALQAVFRNPLADPALIGVSGGASVGAALAIVTGFTALGAASLPLAASAAGLAAALAVYALARRGGRTEITTLVLTGIAVGAIATAAVGLMTYVASPEEMQDIVFWTLGSLGGASWELVRTALPFILVGLVVIPLLARPLDLLALGEREAGHLGVATERVRLTLIVVCALTAGAAVAVAGVIGFVGLIVPHVVRLAAGPANRVVLPASALGGAALLLLADLGARTAASPAELPLGVLTAALGGPFFLWLVHRSRGTGEEWA